MMIYEPGDDGDTGLLHWYAQLVASGDLQKIFGPSMWGLASFMRNMTEQNVTLFYEADETGWWFVSWVVPCLGGASWGVWAREDKRSDLDAGVAERGYDVQAYALERFPVLITLTHQPSIVEKVSRIGYTQVGVVPFLLEGQDGHIAYITRDQFAAKHAELKKVLDGRRSERS